MPKQSKDAHNKSFKDVEDRPESRKKLADKVGKKLRFKATFKDLSHKANSRGTEKPVMILTDLKIVGKRNISAADHVWIDVTKRMLKSIDKELIQGDEIEFDATVSTYDILRKDSAEERQEVFDKFQENQEKQYQKLKDKLNKQFEKMHVDNGKILDQAAVEADTIYQEWYKTPKDKKKQSLDQIKKKQRRAFDNAKNKVKRRNEAFKIKQAKAFDDLKKNGKKNFKTMQREQDNIKLVDYCLINLSGLDVTKRKKRAGVERIKYDFDRAYDVKYTKWLAYRSKFETAGSSKQ